MDPKESSDKTVKDKVQEKLQDFDAKQKVDQVRSFAENNTMDAIAYVVLLLGLIMALFNPHWGMGIIGVVTGFYFGEVVMEYMQMIPNLLENLGIFRCFVLGGAFIALFFSTPMFFITLGATAAAKTMLLNSDSKGSSESSSEESSGE